MDWFIKCFKESFNFSGRARCKEFWMFYLFNTLVNFLFSLIAQCSIVGSILAAVYFLASLPASLAVSFRRLHDTNHSGWNFFLPYVPLIFLFCLPFIAFEDSFLLVGALFLIGILFFGLLLRLFYLNIKDGDIGPNRYGEDPIGDPNRKPRNMGCFIVAIIVACILIPILLAMMLPALSAARKKAGEVVCVNNMKQIGLGLICYANDNNDVLPMELDNAREYMAETNACSADATGAAYQLLESARGLNLRMIENPGETPLVVCLNHKNLIVLFADGCVFSIPRDQAPENIRGLLKRAGQLEAPGR